MNVQYMHYFSILTSNNLHTVNDSFNTAEFQKIYLSIRQSQGVEADRSSIFSHLWVSWGSVARWLVGKYLPPASCLSFSMESLLSLSVPPCCSLCSLIYRTHLISDRLYSLQGSAGSLLKALLTRFVIRKGVKWNVCLPVDWKLDDLLSSFRGNVRVSSAASRCRSSSLVCKSIS